MTEDAETLPRPVRPEAVNGDGEWAGAKDDPLAVQTFTFVRRMDSGQPSAPPTPSDHPDDSDGRPMRGNQNGGISDPGTPSSNQFYELSLELADMVQMAIQTLLQISPPQILEQTKEQFSACALSFCQELPGDSLESSGLIAHTDFDLGELLQSVGDVMSGAAAEAGVDLVLYHGDLGLKYAWVSGSESGLTVALSHVLRQIIGLFIGFAPTPGQEISISDDLVTADALTSSPTTEDGPIHCTIQIAHKFASSSPFATLPECRPEPHFSSLILRRLLRQIGGSLKHDLPSSTAGRTCELSLVLDRAPASITGTPDPAGTEPTLEELAAFAETLKGAKVALYASSKGSFAQHVTRYLADWGMDVSHMSVDGEADGEASSGPPSPVLPPAQPYPPTGEAPAPQSTPVKVETKPSGPQRLSFVFIDDNVAVLKERLNALRVEPPYPLTLNPKRPPLPHHSRRSTTQIPQITRMSSPMPTLANFKIVKDVLQSRVLTQLHMAVTRPPVDPFFSPIATSPATPAPNSFLSYTGHPSDRSPLGGHRPPSARSNSDRSNRSGTKEMFERPGLPPPSPLGMSNSTEYFSEDAVQLGSTPSSGLLISSPPGQPAGIFFSPRSKTPKKSAFGPPMERDKGQLVLPPSTRRTSISRISSDNPTFSSLHEASGSPRAATRGLVIGIPIPPTEIVAPEPVLAPSVVTAEALEAAPQQPGSSPSSPQIGSPTFRRPMRRRTATPDPNVLIVEDNVVNQMQLAGFMRKKKLKYQVANNGLEAVNKWKTGNFDLILMDIQMPVMDGIEATKEIRRLEKLNAAEGVSSYTVTGASPYRSSVIIVAQTASSLNSDRVKALAAGCNDFLTKPVNHHWLNNKVTEWGSIKALQMWADMPPAAGHRGATAHAQQIADRLHVPEFGKKTAAAKAVGGNSEPTTAALNSSVLSSSSSAFWNPAMPSPVSFRGTLGLPEPAPKPALNPPEPVLNTNNPDSPTSAGDTKPAEPAADAPQDIPPDETPAAEIAPVR
ncbi:hypothetical protein B0H17DRAFT_1089640 [Mycena rosella]|uniref:Response regulatory domain-containing protein n=1 Tax=Mycena rosella TaxID=1033263 RepID=A0AAD7CX83_MYCRO|nr:hypothetical protein B0H17DRAFT_1089640 [Mycena rosella]